jgi:hypothetical protein
MKKITFLLALMLILFFSCKELDQYTMFDIEYSYSFDIPAIPEANIPVDITTPPIPTHADSIFDHYSTSPGLIEEVTLTSMQLTTNLQKSSGLDFLSRIFFFLKGDTLPEQELAWRDPVPVGTKDTLELETTPIDLRNYIIGDTLHLRMNLLTDSITQDSMTIKCNMVFHVDAKILGI